MPRMNYVWVGPSPGEHDIGIDTVGPDLMRQNDPDQEIHFYCLDSEVQRYQAYFDERHQGKKKIEVHGIESYVSHLNEIPYPLDQVHYIGHPPESPLPIPMLFEKDEVPVSQEKGSSDKKMKASDKTILLKQAFLDFVEKLKKRAEAFPARRDKIREWITIKEAFDFFIQIYEEGYIADCNVIPDLITKNPLTAPKSFACTARGQSVESASKDPNIMYNPHPSDEAKARFANYFYGVSLF